MSYLIFSKSKLFANSLNGGNFIFITPSITIIAQAVGGDKGVRPRPGREGGREKRQRRGGEEMEAIIRGAPEEIAALVRATQERRTTAKIEVREPVKTMTKDLREAIRGTL